MDERQTQLYSGIVPDSVPMDHSYQWDHCVAGDQTGVGHIQGKCPNYHPISLSPCTDSITENYRLKAGSQ